MISFENGNLVKDSLSTIITRLTDEFKSIWGKTINTEQNTFDGQEINIRGQKEFDDQDVLIKIYNATKLDSAEDEDLDSLCYLGALIRRKQGSKAILDVNVTTNLDNVSLSGVDSDSFIFTVSDSTGNEFQLISSTTIITAGTTLLSFQAVEEGNIIISPDSVTTITTPKVGVESVTNPAKQRIDGATEENDSSFRRRYKTSLASPSYGYLTGLVGDLFAIDDVVGVKVYENDTEITDSNGITPKSIFVIVEGGSDEDIATVIAKKKGSGCGMYNKGGANSVSKEITLPDTDPKVIKFERPTKVNLKIKVDTRTGVDKQPSVEAALLGVSYNLADSARVQDYYDAINDIDGYTANSIMLSRNGVDYFNVLDPQDIVELFISYEVEFVNV